MDNNMANSVTASASQLIHLGSISDTNHKWTLCLLNCLNVTAMLASFSLW